MRMIAIITGVVIGLPLLVGTVVGGILIILLALFEWKLANTWLKMSEKIMEQPEIITEEQFQPAEQFQLKDEPECEIKIYKVAGTSYRVENILKLARENPDYKLRKSEIIEEFKYGKRLYQYEFYPDKIELIPEPDNPEDKHAIKVIADNIHIGYIKASDCRHLLKVISENRIKNIDCEISGGKYKIVVCEDVNYEETYFLRRDEINYYAKLTIEELLTSNQG